MPDALDTLQIGFMRARAGRPQPGSERYYYALMAALRARGDRTRGVIVGHPEAEPAPVPFLDEFATEGSGTRERIGALRRAVRRAVVDADVVASHAPQHTYPVLDLLGRRPLVAHFHGPLVLEGRAEGVGAKQLATRWLAEALSFRRAQRFITLSRSFAAILERSYRVDPARIRIIPGGVDLARFAADESRAAARAALGWDADRPIVTVARRLAPTKGLDVFIDAIALVVCDVPDLLVKIAGSGPLAAALRERTHERGLDATIAFLGQVDDATLARAYRAADVSVVPTQALEGFGLSVVESLACGTPALVTPVTGLPEVVADLDRGLILEGADAPAIARGLVEVLRGARRLPDREACIAYARRFAWPSIAARVADVYAEVR